MPTTGMMKVEKHKVHIRKHLNDEIGYKPPCTAQQIIHTLLNKITIIPLSIKTDIGILMYRDFDGFNYEFFFFFFFFFFVMEIYFFFTNFREVAADIVSLSFGG